jgi:GNAT superfamily N-acetyltransferase
MAASQIRPIAASETHALRHSVLRPHQPAGPVPLPGDDDRDGLHVGAFEDDRLVAIASLCREPPPGSADPGWFRLRGMASLPEQRRRGHGRRLVQACIEHARARGAARIWCTARVAAQPFYASLGFQPRSEVFDLPDIGPHLRMDLELWRGPGSPPQGA